MQEFRFDHSEYKNVFSGDFDAHNPGWIPSETKEDEAGRSAQAFSAIFGIHQLVDFPTRGKNALALIFFDLSGEAKLDVPLGSSGHNAIVAVFKTEHEMSAAPVRAAVYHWGDAP